MRDCFNKGKIHVNRIRITEAKIKELDPSYVSRISKQWYEKNKGLALIIC